MSQKYLVTYTSMVIEADSEEEAIERAQTSSGGGHWEAEELGQPARQDSTESSLSERVYDALMASGRRALADEFVDAQQDHATERELAQWARDVAPVLSEYDRKVGDFDDELGRYDAIIQDN